MTKIFSFVQIESNCRPQFIFVGEENNSRKGENVKMWRVSTFPPFSTMFSDGCFPQMGGGGGKSKKSLLCGNDFSLFCSLRQQ